MTGTGQDARLVIRIDWTSKRVRTVTASKLPAGPMWPEHGLSERARDAGRKAAEALWAALDASWQYEITELARKDLWDAARDHRVDHLDAFEQAWPGFTGWLCDAAATAGCPASDLWLEHILDGFWGRIYTKPNPTSGYFCVRGGRYDHLVRMAAAGRASHEPGQTIVAIEVHLPPQTDTGPIMGGFQPDAGVGGIDGHKVNPVLR